MADATAYVNRVELAIDSMNSVVVAGLRKDNTLAVYFDQDPMYQFNADGQIRRGLVDGVLYRAQGGTLSRLSRHRTDDETVLKRTDLSSTQLAEFLNALDERIQSLASSIEHGNASVTESVPADAGHQILAIVAKRLKLVLQASPRIAPPINIGR